MPGTVTFKPIQANLLRDTDLVGRMNPYCSVSVGSQRLDGQVCKRGGKHPHWNDSITVPVFGSEPTAVLEVLDKDKVTRDDNIGNCTINLQQLQSQGKLSGWFPLYHGDKKAGDILLEASFQEGDISNMMNQQGFTGGQQYVSQTGYKDTLVTEKDLNIHKFRYADTVMHQGGTQMGMQSQSYGQMLPAEFTTQTQTQTTHMGMTNEHAHKFYTEQHQVVRDHTFTRGVPVTEIAPVQKQVTVYEPVSVIKDVAYTEAVPVTRTIELMQPVVVTKEIEVMEPILVNKQIEVIENFPVKKMVEVVEMVSRIQEVDTFEPQTFKKIVEVTEQVPVKKMVPVTEQVTVQKAVEFVEPIIRTEYITKELREPVIVNETITKEVGPSTLLGVVETVNTTQQTLVQEFSTMHVTQGQTRISEEGVLEEGGLPLTRSFETRSNEDILHRDRGLLTRKQEDFIRDRISGFGTNKVEKNSNPL